MDEIRILLADDHALIRDGLKKILSMESGLKIIGEAANGKEAVEMAREMLPHIILMDINMPVMNGIEAAKLIKSNHPGIGIIALTIHDDDEYVSELIKSGVSGYTLKDINSEELIQTIRKVYDGESVFHPDITMKLLGEFRRMAGNQKSHPNLTARELEILECVTRGDNNREISRKLFISEKTVKNHLTNIFRKIDVNHRTQAALYALKHKLTKM